MTNFINKIRIFEKSGAGGITAMAMFVLVAGLVIGGYAVDVSSVMMERTRLQVTADAAAHGALTVRDQSTAAAANAVALQLANLNMPTGQFGTVLNAQDITFGNWDARKQVFTAEPGSKMAVKVVTRRTQATSNSISTFLLKLVGKNDWDVSTSTVFVTYQPTCLREGFVAEGIVDIQSNNTFTNGFCIHSNTHVELNSNNYFEAGTVVSMPDPTQIQLPASGFKSNIGLSDALRAGTWKIKILSRIDKIIAGLGAFDPNYLPSYITSYSIKTLPSSTVLQADLLPGSIYRFTCGGAGNNTLTFKNSVILKSVVVLTDCDVKFGSGSALEDAVLATTSTSSTSIDATSGLRIGLNDNCAPGGGAQIVTAGGVRIPAALEMYGGQILAKRDINFAANANGIQGTSMVAGGVVSGTSNMTAAFCGSGMEGNFVAGYFKLVE